MNVKLPAAVLVIACAALFGYVAVQWPKPEAEINIPVGRVETIPGTKLKGILCQGERGGLSLWYPIERHEH